MVKVTCLILNFNDADTTLRLVKKIRNYNTLNYILIIDNCSTDDSYSILCNKLYKEPNVIIKSTSKNGGYGYGNNFGIKYAYYNLKSKYVIVTNPDVFFTNALVKKMIKVMENNKVSLVSAEQRINNNVIYDKAWRIPTPFQWTMSESRLGRYFSAKYHYKDTYFKSPFVKVDCVPGAMFMVNAKDFLRVGGYDERMFLFCEETVLGFKLKEVGLTTVLLTREYYDHQHSVTINKNIKSRIRQQKILHNSKMIFFKKYQHSSKISLWIYSVVFRAKIIKMKLKDRLKNYFEREK